jgi:hypothetical protein
MYGLNENQTLIAALAHLGERQTEVHFCPSCISKSILEALCSIHRSGKLSFCMLHVFCLTTVE